MQANLPPPSAAETAVDESGFAWPVAFMRRERFHKGQRLFNKGDPADKLFYVSKGTIRLPELGRSVLAGQVIGEMGIFAPDRCRSASAVVEDDVEAYTMGEEEVRALMSRDPALATNLIEVIIKRMMDHLQAEAEARERVNAELRIARNIQASMLPREFPLFPGPTEIFAVMEPAQEVGGDLYDFFLIDEHKLCAVIGDVSGKGVPAALLMARSKTLLRSEAMRGYPAAEILARVNNALCPENPECMFLTAFCLVLDTRTGEAECCTAGHTPPLVCSRDGTVEFMTTTPGLLIGFEAEVRYDSKPICLQPGDMLFLYTDGVTEAENPKQEPFSEERFKTSIAARRAMSLREIVSGVRQDITQFTQGRPQSDDISLLALKYCGEK
jgi:sigma-B regulation protein RsbU (phosphoserine phosphatase)